MRARRDLPPWRCRVRLKGVPPVARREGPGASGSQPHEPTKGVMLSNVAADLANKARWYGLSRSLPSLLRMAASDGSTAQILYRLMRFCQTHRLAPLAFIVYRLNAFVGHV